MYANGGLGIDLAGGMEDTFGVTDNRSGNGVRGPNHVQHGPELSEATTVLTVTTIRGTLSSRPGIMYIVKLFACYAADPSGFGEGRAFLGSVDVVTAGSSAAELGLATFTFTTTLPAGQSVITATATDTLVGDTSKFSRAIQAVRINAAPTARSASVTLPDNGEVAVTLRGSDPTETPDRNLVYTITSLPTRGMLFKSDGTPVTVGSTLTDG